MLDGYPAEVGTEKPADLMREERESEQRREITHAEELAHDGGSRWNRGEPGETEAYREYVERPLGLRRGEIPRDQDGARRIHHRQDVLAPKTRGRLARDQAARDIGETDQRNRPACDRGVESAQADLPRQVRDKKRDVESAREKTGVQQEV